jgi:apolipoprotein N-acyltransferase
MGASLKSGQSTHQTKRAASRGRREPAVESGFVNQSRWRLVAAAALSLVLLVLSFAPIDFWPLAYICFVPWLFVVCVTETARRVYVISYVLGILFFCISIHWLFLVTVPGALALFLAFALHFPLVACPVRHLVRRRGLPLAFVFPFIWVGCEAVRSMVVLEFPWNLLGHSQHGVLTMIQISDLVGAYGVSFVVAAVNGMIADLVLCRVGWPTVVGAVRKTRSAKASMVYVAVLVLATVVYGQVQLRRGTMEDGPRIAVIQGNYPNYVDWAKIEAQPTSIERANRYFDLLAAAAGGKPDLFLLPETPWSMYLNREFLDEPLTRWFRDAYDPRTCYEALRGVAVDNNAFLVTGSASCELTPLDLLARERRYNSAFVFAPDGEEPERYDKTHLVLIGEYAPFRYGSLRFIYLWLNRIVPFGSDEYEYSLTPGKEFTTFEMTAPSRGGKTYRFATPICYENVMPYISRRFVTGEDGRKRCDFLLNLSNDGWFPHSWELPQHLAASVFRAVENRVGVARAVNTGISCFVDPDGHVHHMVNKDGVVVGPGVDGFEVANVRVDSRHSVYSRTGDVFAIFCGVVWGLFYLDYIVVRSMTRGAQKGGA